MEEDNTEQGRDSIKAIKNTKGYNYEAKCYIGGSNDLTDTPEKMLQRLHMYMNKLKETYGENCY